MFTYALPIQLGEKIDNLGVRYTRRLPSAGTNSPGKTWQDAFNTESRDDVEAQCLEHEYEFEWTPDDTLVCNFTRTGFISHPVTQIPLFVNGMSSLHSSIYNGWDPYDKMDTNMRPWNTSWGDGSPISLDEIEAIDDLSDDLAMAVADRTGDILVLDNFAYSHGRLPYRGKRELGVMIGDPVNPAEIN